jgi:single-strand DNA-binding protein
MASFNKVILLGNLTRDPELRYTPKGTAVAGFGLAVNRSYTTEAGEKKEEVTFVDIDAFGRTAEIVGQYLKKGRPVFIEGRLRYQTWDDKQTGQKKSKLGVILESFQFLDFKGGGVEGAPDQAAPPPRPRPAQSAAAQPSPAPGAESDGPPEGDDVPF